MVNIIITIIIIIIIVVVVKVAKELQINEDIYFGSVTTKTTCQFFKKNKTIDRTPSVVVVGSDNSRKSINLDELYGIVVVFVIFIVALFIVVIV